MHQRSTRSAGGVIHILALVLASSIAIPNVLNAPVVAAAEASADIPGIPLPGPVAAGRLGGAIYDVVYSLNVAPGYVIVASVTGTASTDFDMYLFDATATTVLSTTGLLTTSRGPTSTESISWPSRLGGTYYIDLNGATDVEGDYLLTVQTLPDPTAPTVAMLLASGRPSVSQLTVPVTLTASDDLSGVADMAFSEDGTTFSDWEPFKASASWTFEPGDGPRQLWAKVRNGVGLESTVATDSVAIDTTPPTVTAVAPAPGSSVAGLRPTFTVAFNEPMDPASWMDHGLIVQSASGALVTGLYAYNSATRTGSFVPSTPLQPGALYVVTVGNVNDVAGNTVLSTGSWSITPLTPTSMTAATNLKVILPGGSARIDLALGGAPLPATIEVLSSTSPSGFVPLPPISTDDGSNSLIVTPASNTTYRFHYAGTFGVAPAEGEVRILVRRSAVLAGRDSAVTSRARVGASIRLTAAIGPASAGVGVSFRLYRFDAGRRAWVYAGSKGRSTDASGRAVYTWVPPSSGSWYWRVAVASTAAFANNTSPVYRWSISR